MDKQSLKSTQKPVAVILLNWNTPQHTIACIHSLNRFCDKKNFNIIVADNGSTDGSLPILRMAFPTLTYIDNQTNLGFAEGNNRALKYSLEQGYGYSLLLNTDTLVETDVVSDLLNHLENHQQAGGVQPAIYWMHDKTSIWNGDCYVNGVFGYTYHKKTKELQHQFNKVQWLTGCCCLLRNTVLAKTGGFNARFFLYYEDVELSYRLRAAGYELHYLPSVSMYHEAGASGKAAKDKEGTLSPIIHYYVSRNKIWFFRNYGNPLFYPLMFLYNAPYFVGLLAYFILRGRKKKAGYLFKGLKDGFFTPKALIWPL
ncbi:GT2 family glycosyltransferase [Pedobacter sp. CAN_A7]|uniref:glycosyltransferase family 2 protein n=1 Tax=Pedobacter sp. CAN_A7 TaxID=2787722 RepID=UPI0018C93DF1